MEQPRSLDSPYTDTGACTYMSGKGCFSDSDSCPLWAHILEKVERGLDWIDWRARAQSATHFLALESILTPFQTTGPILIHCFYLSRRVLQLYALSVPFGIEVFPGVIETTWCPIQRVLT